MHNFEGAAKKFLRVCIVLTVLLALFLGLAQTVDCGSVLELWSLKVGKAENAMVS